MMRGNVIGNEVINMTIFWGLIIPFIGTTAGAACVLFMKNELKPVIQKALLGLRQESWWLLLCGLY